MALTARKGQYDTVAPNVQRCQHQEPPPQFQGIASGLTHLRRTTTCDKVATIKHTAVQKKFVSVAFALVFVIFYLFIFSFVNTLPIPGSCSI